MAHDLFLAAGLVTAALAAAVLLWYLLRRPALGRRTKIVLLFGIGILPLIAATNGNIAGYHATKTTRFCTGSCHVMAPYGNDIGDGASTSLAARHSRNAAFGGESCYACHADYGMFGTVTTKIGGLRHVYEYLTHYHAVPAPQFLGEIELRTPFRNATCVRCHSTQTLLWNKVPDHESARDELRADTVSCASEGCHGFAHPFSKVRQRVGELGGVP